MHSARSLLPIGVLLLGGIGLLARASRPPADPSADPQVAAEDAHECVLGEGMAGWCEACAAGTLGSLRIESRVLFDALDAHGHEIDPASIECAICIAALDDGGFCDDCRMGFVDEQAYLSRLTYLLARGTVIAPSAADCEVCRRHSEDHGWCSACDRGLVGTIALRDRGEYERAAAAYADVVRANELAGTCQLCSAALVLGGTCPKCRLDYADPSSPRPIGR